MESGYSLGDIIVRIKADLSDFKRGLDEAKVSTSGFSDFLGNATAASTSLLVGVTAVAAAATAFGVSSVKAYSESQDRLTQLQAVLKSTGGIAGWTADQAIALSKSLEGVTRYSDEDVLSVENLLLTFTSIGKDIMPKATETVLNMATALGEDTKSASIQLGKALQDPILGMTALRRVGVEFTTAQIDTVKQLVATGQSAKAQTMIMAELTKEFGGSAVAAGTTFGGQMALLKNRFNDFQEVVGQTIITAITPFLKGLNDWYEKAGGADGIMKQLTATLEKVKPYIPEIAGALIAGLIPAFIALGGAILGSMPYLLVFMAAGALLAEAFVLLKKNGIDPVKLAVDGLKGAWEAIKPSVDALGDSFNTQLLPALDKLGKLLGPVATPAIKDFARAIIMLDGTYLWLYINSLNIAIKAISDFIQWVSDIPQAIHIAATAIDDFWRQTKQSIDNITNTVVDAVTRTYDKLATIAAAWWAALVREFKRGGMDIWMAMLDFDIKTVTQFGKTFDAWWDAFKNWAEKLGYNTYIELDNWWKSINKWLAETPGKITRSLDAWWKAIKKWLDDLGYNTYIELDGWWTAISEWMHQVPSKLSKELEAWWTALETWLKGIPKQVTDQLEAWKQAFITWFKNLPKELASTLTQSGKDMANQQADSFTSVWKDAKKLGEIAGIIALGLIAVAILIPVTAFLKFGEVGGKIITFMLQAMNEGLGILLSWTTHILGAILNALGDAGGFLVNSGKALMKGFLNGIVSGFEDVKKFVGGIAGWFPKNKGPIEYDKTLLVQNGQAIMDGLNHGLMAGWEQTQALVKSMGVNIAGNLTMSGLGGTQNSITTNVNGPINIANQQQADAFFKRLSRNQELAGMGLTSQAGSVG